MILQSELVEVINQQNERLVKSEKGLIRNLLSLLPDNLQNHALIISGIRRSGKSTLLKQHISLNEQGFFFLNFDTPKLYNFELTDFAILDIIIKQAGVQNLYFDEIQGVEGWELYVRQKLDEGYCIVITGSNASLLSKELGTKLTGRHIAKEFFPFSFLEFCSFYNIPIDHDSFEQYSTKGGFPEFLKTLNNDILSTLIDDILYRDIAVRHNIRDIKSLKRLLLFLVANIGNLISATKLTQSIGIKSTATVLDYFSYFEQSYLVQFMPKFAWSYKVQIVNPRKVYFIDTGLLAAITPAFSKDEGRKLENIVFWELRRKSCELFYYNENGKECDFVVCYKNQPHELIQVCYNLKNENISREKEGLIDAMNFFGINKGTIITFDQEDKITAKGKLIQVVPIANFLKDLN